jgi:hypothetical protein
MDELMEIAALRFQGARCLQAIAAENGTGSLLYRSCWDLWVEREEGADLSVTWGDLGNAIKLLQLGLHALHQGPAALKQGGLSPEDVAKLLRAA